MAAMEPPPPALLARLSVHIASTFGLVEDALKDGLARAVLLRARERGMDPEDLAVSLLGSGPGEETELGRLVHHLLLGHTRFFRHESVWEELGRKLPETFRNGPISALVAGCSSGEEAWTAAFFLAAKYGIDRFQVSALDISPIALEIARRGIYPTDETARLPADWRRDYLQAASDRGFDAVAPAIRERVSFQWGNLARKVPAGPFHLVLCRNVLTYFARPVAVEVIQGLFRSAVPGGCLVLASQELPLAEAASTAVGRRWLPTLAGLPVLREEPALGGRSGQKNANPAPSRDWERSYGPAGDTGPAGETSKGERTGGPVEPGTSGQVPGAADLPSALEDSGTCRLALPPGNLGMDTPGWALVELELLQILRVPPRKLILDIKAVKGVDFRVKGRLARAVGLLRCAGTDVHIDGEERLLSW